ncbi:MAG: methyltransferase, partial [Rikenellaceae bacterium]
IIGVEINPDSAEQAHENIATSPWSERVSVECCAIQEFHADRSFDLIVSNPPYFVDALLSNNEGRTLARHTTTLPFEELISISVRLLNPQGRLSIILPLQESKYFDSQLRGRLHLTRRCEVFSRKGKECKRLLSEYSPAHCVSPSFEQLVIEEDTPPQYTEAYKNLTRDFYLKF